MAELVSQMNPEGEAILSLIPCPIQIPLPTGIATSQLKHLSFGI